MAIAIHFATIQKAIGKSVVKQESCLLNEHLVQRKKKIKDEKLYH